MAKFISKFENHIVCVKPDRQQVVDGIIVNIQGEHIRFNKNEYATKDPKIIEFLRSKDTFGVEIVEVEDPAEKAQLEAEEKAKAEAEVAEKARIEAEAKAKTEAETKAKATAEKAKTASK